MLSETSPDENEDEKEALLETAEKDMLERDMANTLELLDDVDSDDEILTNLSSNQLEKIYHKDYQGELNELNEHFRRMLVLMPNEYAAIQMGLLGRHDECKDKYEEVINCFERLVRDKNREIAIQRDVINELIEYPCTLKFRLHGNSFRLAQPRLTQKTTVQGKRKLRKKKRGARRTKRCVTMVNHNDEMIGIVVN